jgi:hypothetical protein
MAVIQPSRRATDATDTAGAGSTRRLILCLVALCSCAAAAQTEIAGSGEGAEVSVTGFDSIYAMLYSSCGDCHVQGLADGPWSLNTPPGPERFPECLAEAGERALLCAAYHQLVDAPAPGIPAWIRPAEAAQSEPYAQACDPAVSFHIGHSLPERLPDASCAMFLDWIESGAQR